MHDVDAREIRHRCRVSSTFDYAIANVLLEFDSCTIISKLTESYDCWSLVLFYENPIKLICVHCKIMTSKYWFVINLHWIAWTRIESLMRLAFPNSNNFRVFIIGVGPCRRKSNFQFITLRRKHGRLWHQSYFDRASYQYVCTETMANTTVTICPLEADNYIMNSLTHVLICLLKPLLITCNEWIKTN